MAITRVWLDERKEDCTPCGLFQEICAEVFAVPKKMQVKQDANLSKEDEIKAAAESCPVNVIAIEYDNSGKRDNEST